MANVPFTAIYPDGPAGSAAAAAGGDLGGPGGNLQYPGMPAGASPVHRDIVAAAAGTYDVWDPGAGYRFVVASAFISASAAGRVALVDDVDVQGSRIADADFAANGGASPNLVPVPYPAKLAGNKVRVVTTVVGNTRIRVSGWLQAA